MLFQECLPLVAGRSEREWTRAQLHRAKGDGDVIQSVSTLPGTLMNSPLPGTKG